MEFIRKNLEKKTYFIKINDLVLKNTFAESFLIGKNEKGYSITCEDLEDADLLLSLTFSEIPMLSSIGIDLVSTDLLFLEGFKSYQTVVSNTYDLMMEKVISLKSSSKMIEVLKTMTENLDERINNSDEIPHLYLAHLTKDLELKDFADEVIWKVGILQIPDYENWKETYTSTEYLDEFRNLYSENEWSNIEFPTIEQPHLKITFDVNSFHSTISAEFIKISEKLLHYHQIIKNKISKPRIFQINLGFDFPESLKISCEQYLLYFAQFLQDLGINATSNLREEAGKVLFSVTPTDDVEALDKIREALAVYLNLPASPIVYDDSFAAMRLQQQVENLQHAQKMAAREIQLTEKLLVVQSATIQEKNLVISQKDSVIEQKDKIIEKILSKSIMMDSAENKEQLEEIYDGLKIGESKFLREQLGIHLNPAKVIKTAVKNTFGKDDEKNSVLGLNED